MPRRNHNANPDRARRRRCYLCGAGRAVFAGMCDDCAALELESDPATWTIPGDGFADGGTPYSDDELELERRPAA